MALVDPLAVEVAPMARVLAGPGTMVAHAAEQDLEVLERACGRSPTRLFDTQVAAGFLGQGSSSLASLAQAFLGLTIAKGDRLTDWRRRPLTDSQLAYAAADVENLLELANAIGVQLDAEGRRRWAEEECAALLGRPHGAPDPNHSWWKLRDARQLRGASRGVAQEVAAWRERRAQAVDLPVRTVLPDLALQAIAHRPPTSMERSAAPARPGGPPSAPGCGRGPPGCRPAGSGPAGPDLQLPPVEDVPKEYRAAVALLIAWVAQLARDERVDAAVLATRGDLAAYLRGDPDVEAGPGVAGRHDRRTGRRPGRRPGRPGLRRAAPIWCWRNARAGLSGRRRGGSDRRRLTAPGHLTAADPARLTAVPARLRTRVAGQPGAGGGFSFGRRSTFRVRTPPSSSATASPIMA